MLTNTHWTKPRGLRVLLTTLLVGTALGAGGVAWSSSDSVTRSQAASAPLSLPPVANQAGFADLVAKVQPAVVEIATTGREAQMRMPSSRQGRMRNLPQGSPFGDMFKPYFGQDQMPEQQNLRPTHALGSGFIIDAAGYIVTNNHLIDDAHEIKVTLTDGKEYSANIVGRDSKTDLALLKIDAGKPLPYVAFGDSSKERAGDWVIAVGNPYGLGGTVTAGIVSAHDRDINAGAYDDFLQIDAPINPGNSGGPLFDQSGHVIGIDTSIYSPSGGSVGIGFAIPSNLAQNIVAQLRDHGKVERGWLGVQMQPITPSLAKAVGLAKGEGVLVNEVQENSPAARAMLKQGDVITSFNGKDIKTPRDLAVAVSNTQAGKAAMISIWRDQHTSTLNVTIRTQPAREVAAAEASPSPASVGMMLKPLTDDERSQLGFDSSVKGVVVARVDQDSPAAKSGVQAGDVIVRVGNDRVNTPSQAVEDIETAQREKKEAIPLLVMREGTTYYLGLQLVTG